MEALEQVTVLMTLMQRLGQVLDHERAVLRGLHLNTLADILDEKLALTDAYEIELQRLRHSPETIAALDPAVRTQLHEAMQAFQETVSANANALLATQTVIEKVVQHVGQSLAATGRGLGYGARGEAAAAGGGGSAQVIPVAFDRQA